mmetsp:Transcript_28497/g.94389  ORF Transcript_28497/g.94389 Transcript_28497/m.94389 type:complete len:224 (+) Transcript_28497:857-1528(+)
MDTMRSCVTPPPRLPQPADVAFATPTISWQKSCVVQNCVTTKVPPPMPMRKRTMPNDHCELTDMPTSVMTEIHARSTDWQSFGPTLSQSGPTAKRVSTVDATEQMLTVKTPLMVMPRSARTRTMSGANANQQTKAKKKEDQAKWKPRMWGRWKLKSWISLAFHPWCGSTGIEPIFHVPGDVSVNLYWALGCWTTSPPLPDSREDMMSGWWCVCVWCLRVGAMD